RVRPDGSHPVGNRSGSGYRLPLAGCASCSRAMTRPLDVIDLGHRDYLEVLDLQRALRLRRIAGEEPTDLLLLVEHPPVYTLGRSTKDTSLPMSLELLQR